MEETPREVGDREGGWDAARGATTLADAWQMCLLRGAVGCHLQGDHRTLPSQVSVRGLVFEWTNLFPACSWCNEAKGEKDHQRRMLKPDDEDAEQFLELIPETGRLQPREDLPDDQRRRAEETIALCDLNRGGALSGTAQPLHFDRRMPQRDPRNEEDIGEASGPDRGVQTRASSGHHGSRSARMGRGGSGPVR